MYDTQKYYFMKLRILSSLFCFFVFFPIWKNSALYCQPQVSFVASVTTGCAPLAVQFQSSVSGINPVSYFWNFGNGNTSTQANPIAFFNSTGTFTISLTVSDGVQSITTTYTDYITINEPPQASFSAVPIYSACGQQEIHFYSTSTPGSLPIVNYNWVLGDGNMASDSSFNYTYSSSGTYGVTLFVTSSDGCQASATQNIVATVNPPLVQANFTASATNSCLTPFTVSFQNQTVAPAGTQFYWDFGNGQSSTLANPTVTYNAVGAYTVTLLAVDPQSGCADTHSIPAFITITPVATAAFQLSANSVCPGQVIQTINQSGPAGASYLWSFGNGQTSTMTNPSIVYSTPGTYTITLHVDAGGCNAQTSQTIVVNPKPTANFTVNQTYACQLPATFSFTNSSSGATSYHWSFGGAAPNSLAFQPNITVNSYGTYNVRLIATNQFGCKDTLFMPNLITVQPMEITIIPSTPSVCNLPATVEFSATTSIPGVSLSDYQWIFDNGYTSNVPNPTVTINQTGSLGVTLIAQASNGCVDTVQNDNAVVVTNGQVLPSFQMNPTVVCAGYPVSFTNTSVGGSYFTWLANGDVFSTEYSPSKVFYYPDTVEISLVGSGENCPADTSPAQTLIILPSSAIFNIKRTCDGSNTVIFSDFDQSATSLWLYPGDGSSVNILGLSSYTHTYNPNNQYSSYVISQNSQTGCIDTFQRSFFVPQFSLDFNYTPQSGCTPLDVTFTSATTGFTTLRWFFGNGQSTNSIVLNANNPVSTVTKTYDTPGNYQPFLVGSYHFGGGVTCRDTIKKPLIVGGSFSVNIQVLGYSGCGPVNVQFAANAPAGAQLLWDFGDGTTSTATAPSHTFANFIGNTVVLQATLNGCTAVDTLSGYELYPGLPFADVVVAPQQACPWTPISFATFVSGSYSSLYWDFGDGQILSGPVHFHTYGTTGHFMPKVVVTDLNGCTMEFPAPLVTITQPTASFQILPVQQICPPALVSFQNTSLDATEYLWYFDNGATSTAVHPTTHYLLPGYYEPWLVAQDQNGCTDTFSVPAGSLLIPGPILEDLVISDPNPCPGQQVNFDIISPNATLFILNLNSTGQYLIGEHVNYTYQETGVYNPFVTLGVQVGSQFCLVNFPQDTLVVAPLDIQVVSPAAICGGTTTSLSATGAVQYEWHPASAFSQGNTGPEVTALIPENGWIWVKGTDENGCEDTDSLFIQILPKPTAAFAFDDRCVYNSYSFQNTSVSQQPIQSYTWIFDSFGQSNQENPQFTFPQAGQHSVTLIIETVQGCTDTLTQTVNVYPKPNAVINVLGNCENAPVELINNSYVVGPYTIQEVQWFVDGNNIPPTGGNNCSIYLSGGEHDASLVVGTNTGCRDTAHKGIFINYKPEALFSVQSPLACTGEPILISDHSFIPGSNGSLTWYFRADNGHTDIQPGFPGQVIEYQSPYHGPVDVTLIVTSSNGCSDTLTADNFFYVSPPVFALFDLNPPVVNILDPKVTMLNQSVGYTSLLWDFGDGTTSTLEAVQHIYQNPGEYKVTLVATNQYGCQDDTTAIVTVTPEVALYIPNTFTPFNHDGINDVFSVKGMGITTFEILIFNRWGEKIFESNDFNFRWDGRYRGSLVPQGTYVYRVIATDIYAKTYDFHGTVNVLY